LTARELECVSQSHFAFRVGTSQPTLSAYELGARIPTLKTLIRIANAAGLDLVIGLREASTEPLTPGIPTPLLGILRLGSEGLPSFTILHEPRNAPSDLPQ
jgi:transcriptional regulator with XRE-family HTH domain